MRATSFSIKMDCRTTLLGIAVSALNGNQFNFLDGSVAVFDSLGNDSLNGTANDDLFDISDGGNDSVDAGDGDDVIFARSELSSGDIIDGGDGSDELFLSGVMATSVGFSATTVTGLKKSQPERKRSTNKSGRRNSRITCATNGNVGASVL